MNQYQNIKQHYLRCAMYGVMFCITGFVSPYALAIHSEITLNAPNFTPPAVQQANPAVPEGQQYPAALSISDQDLPLSQVQNNSQGQIDLAECLRKDMAQGTERCDPDCGKTSACPVPVQPAQ